MVSLKSKSKFSDSQRKLLQMIFDHFKLNGKWPNARYLQVEFRSEGDSYAVLKEIGFPLIQSLPDKFDHAGDVKLSIQAITLCEGSEKVIDVFIRSLKACVERYLENPVRAVVTYDELKSQLVLTELGSVVACQLLLIADHVIGSSSIKSGWIGSTFTVHPDALRFENVQNIDNYLQVLSPTPKEQKANVEKESLVLSLNLNQIVAFETLHASIVKKCGRLFADGHYSEAALNSFKVVKDKLRELTGHEKAHEAFGSSSGLKIPGAAAQNVEGDFEQGVKFLAMAIDNFRNEKSHTAEGAIDDPIHAYEYLRLSSLVMHFLDRVKVKRGQKVSKKK